MEPPRTGLPSGRPHGSYSIDMIRVNDDIQIDENELNWDFVRASGPGGQHVNKASTAAILRFDAAKSPFLSNRVRARLKKLAGRRMTAEGHLLIKADRFRSQLQNRQDAVERLCHLIRRAAVAPKRRRATKPTRTSVEKRLAGKKHRSRIKHLRGKIRS